MENITISDFTHMIEKSGPLIIIAAIFFYIIIKLVNFAFRTWDIKLSRQKHNKLLDTRTQIGTNIQELIDIFLTTHSGNRIQVVEFSNSVTSVAYLPFRYMTCTYESYAFGKCGVGNRFDRISTSLFNKFFKHLYENEYWIVDIQTSEHGAMCELLESFGETKSLNVRMHSPKNKSIGYIAMTSDSDFTEKDIQDIQDLAVQISTLLCIVDK